MDEVPRYKPLSTTPGPKMFSIFGSEIKEDTSSTCHVQWWHSYRVIAIHLLVQRREKC